MYENVPKIPKMPTKQSYKNCNLKMEGLFSASNFFPTDNTVFYISSKMTVHNIFCLLGPFFIK